MDLEKTYKQILNELKTVGFLMVIDPVLPSVASIVAGEPVRGSWWAHPKGRHIFEVNSRLADYPDVLTTKLISGKTTFVHRKLWSPLFCAASEQELWQMNGLSKPGRDLLSKATKLGQLRTDQLAARSGMESKIISKAAQELENRLLVCSEQVHTETGKHAKQLESWKHWAARIDLSIKPMTPEDARRMLESVLDKLNTTSGTLPWMVRNATRK